MDREEIMRYWSQFDLSTRTCNCFANAGIQSIDDLTKWSRLELLRLREFGQKSLNEVKEFLGDRRLGLKPVEKEQWLPLGIPYALYGQIAQRASRNSRRPKDETMALLEWAVRNIDGQGSPTE